MRPAAWNGTGPHPNLKDDMSDLFLTTLLAGEDFVSYYGMPLIAKGQVKGVMEIFHRATLNRM